MNKLSRTLFAGAALAMPLIMLGTTPAVAAHVDAAAITGQGTISPGLGICVDPNDPVKVPDCTQSISFDGTATAVGSDSSVGNPTPQYSCSFTGTDLFGTVAEGVGTVSGNCGPLAFSLCAFVREAAIVEVACGGVVNAAAAVCAFRPVDTLPTTAYTLVCGAVAATTAP